LRIGEEVLVGGAAGVRQVVDLAEVDVFHQFGACFPLSRAFQGFASGLALFEFIKGDLALRDDILLEVQSPICILFIRRSTALLLRKFRLFSEHSLYKLGSRCLRPVHTLPNPLIGQFRTEILSFLARHSCQIQESNTKNLTLGSM